jgi:hypothetical protein
MACDGLKRLDGVQLVMARRYGMKYCTRWPEEVGQGMACDGLKRSDLVWACD